MNLPSLASALSILVLFAHPSLPAQDPAWQKIDADLRTIFDNWGIPGASVAVVKDDRIVWAESYGVREVGEQDRVDVETVFAIGSITKSFTAACMMLLVEEGVLDLDRPVTEYKQDLRFVNARLDDSLTTRDLLSHRSGVNANNLVFWGNGWSRDQVLEKVPFLAAVNQPGKQFLYNNIMFLAAGEVIPQVSEHSWDEFLRERILQPLGMERSSPGLVGLDRLENVASAHFRVDGSWQAVEAVDLHNCGPGGSMYSTAQDMTQFMRMMLNEGDLDGVQILDEVFVAEMFEPQIAIPAAGGYGSIMPFSQNRAYGLGWFLHDYYGLRIVEHSGQTDSMHAAMILIPDLELGVVVLSNALNIGLPHAMAYRVVDAFLDRDPEPASKAFRKLWQSMESTMSMNSFQAPSGSWAIDRETLPRYPGSFSSNLYGELTLILREGRLEIDLLGRRGVLHSSGPGAFAVDWRGDLFLSISAPQLRFNPGVSPQVDQIVMPGVGRFNRKN